MASAALKMSQEDLDGTVNSVTTQDGPVHSETLQNASFQSPAAHLALVHNQPNPAPEPVPHVHNEHAPKPQPHAQQPRHQGPSLLQPK